MALVARTAKRENHLHPGTTIVVERFTRVQPQGHYKAVGCMQGAGLNSIPVERAACRGARAEALLLRVTLVRIIGALAMRVGEC